MPLARTHLHTSNHLQLAVLLLQKFGDPFCTFDMIMVRDSNEAKSFFCCLFNHLRRAAPTIAQVGMHVNIGATVPGRANLGRCQCRSQWLIASIHVVFNFSLVYGTRQRKQKTGALTRNALAFNPYLSAHRLSKLTTEIKPKTSATLDTVDRFFQSHKFSKEVDLVFETDTCSPIMYRYQDKLA